MTPHDRRIRARFHLPPLGLGLGLLGGVLLPLLPASPAFAQATTQRDFAIPAGPLPRALSAFAAATGTQLLYSPELAAGRNSPGVSGRMEPSEALRRLLAGTGLTARFTGPGAATLAPAPASAPAASDEVPVPEVLVTGTSLRRAWQPNPGYAAEVEGSSTKTDTPLIESPQSVGVVTRDQIDDQNAQTVTEALRYTAGVLTEARPTPSRFDNVFIRGFGDISGSTANYVGFLDGLRMQRGITYATPALDPWLMERIEVLRGPASVLYGQSSPGGLVNLVSRRPLDVAGGEVRLEAGSGVRLQTAFDLYGPLTEDRSLSYRLTGLARRADADIDHTREERIAIAPAVTWRPTADTSLTLLASYQYDPADGYYGFFPESGTLTYNRYGRIPSERLLGNPNWNRYERRQYLLGYQFEHRFDDVFTARQNLRWQHVATNTRTTVYNQWIDDGRTISQNANADVELLESIAVDNQLQARFDTGRLNHTVLAGLDYQRSQAKEFFSYWRNVGTLDVFAPVYAEQLALGTPLFSNDTRQVQEQTGLYLQDQIRFDRLVVTLGGRQDWASSRTDQRLGTASTTKQSDDAFTWRAGAVYLFDNGIAPYASYSESFQPVAGTGYSGNPFQPTEGRQYEVGLRYQPPGRQSLLQVSAFHLTQTNVLTADPEHDYYSIQQGERRVRGIEVEGRGAITPELSVIAAYAYLDPKITKSNDGDQGNRPSAVPNHIASGWLDYTFRDGPLRGLGVGLGARYVGPTYAGNNNHAKVPDYLLADGALRYDLGALREDLRGVQLTLNATNIFDREYVSSCIASDGCFYGLRRSVIGGVRLKW